MTLAELRTLLTSVTSATLDNFYGESPSNANLLLQLNWSLRTISRHLCQFDPMITLRLAEDDQVIDLRDAGSDPAPVSKRVVKVSYVVIDGSPLCDASGQHYGVWTLAELERLASSTWRTDAANEPRRAVVYGDSKLLLHPKVNAATAALDTHYIAGTYLADDLSADGDVPGFEVELHEAVAFLAAIYASSPTISEAEGWKRLKEMAPFAYRMMDEIRQENKRLAQSWGTTGGYAGEDFVYA